MKFIVIIILILQSIAFAKDKSDFHWTQKIFIKEKNLSDHDKEAKRNCHESAKNNMKIENIEYKKSKDECNEKQQ